MRIQLAASLCLVVIVAVGCENPSPGVTATQPKSADTQDAGAEVATPQPTSRPSSGPATTQSTATTKPADDADDPKLPPFIKILERSGTGPARIEVIVDGDQRITLKTTNVAKFRITRKESPLAKDRSVALRIDTVGVEWTRARQTLILQRTSTGDWLSEEEVEKKP